MQCAGVQLQQLRSYQRAVAILELWSITFSKCFCGVEPGLDQSFGWAGENGQSLSSPDNVVCFHRRCDTSSYSKQYTYIVLLSNLATSSDPTPLTHPKTKSLKPRSNRRRQKPRNHNNRKYILPRGIGCLLHAPPLRPVLRLTDALLRRPVRHVGRDRFSGKLHAVVVGEDAYGVGLAEAGAEVDGDGVVG